MKYLKNEKGYALFLTVFIIVLFSILAVSLITIVLSGANKTAVREDITQAKELSDKGLEHIVNQINKELQDEIGETGLPRSEFASTLTRILDQYSCKNGEHLSSDSGETGEYKVCIENYKNVLDPKGEENELRKLVEFRSEGENVNKRTQEIISYIEIGAGSVPETLKYVLGTNEPSGSKKNGAGNIYLHGGVEIYGDINAGNNLFTFDHGPGLDNYNAFWRQTTLPVLYPSSSSENSKIVLGGDLYQFKSSTINNNFSTKYIGNNIQRNTSLSFYNDHLAWRYPSRYEKSKIKDMFANESNLPIIAKRDWSGIPVSIENNIEEGKNNIRPTTNIAEKVFRNINTNQSVSFKNYYRFLGLTLTNNYMTFRGNNRFNSGEIQNGTRTTFEAGNYEFDSMYINTDVVIGNSTNSEDTRFYDNITIGGYSPNRGAQLFVDGNVTIQGANLTSNLTIYTTGTVTIQNTTIQGKEFAYNREGSLIVFSKGRVHISNNSLYQNTPSELKGYFYSEDNLELFGVGSNMKIHGGIAARRITLNAIRGNYQNEKRDWQYAMNPTSLQSPSRLVIEYDTDLIENYLRMNPPEPVIYGVDPPELIERYYSND